MSSEKETWPRWDRRTDGYAALARYATTKTLRGLALIENDAYRIRTEATRRTGDGRDGTRAVVSALYERIRQRGYPYNTEPWHAGVGQIIRPVTTLHSHSGTCLDVALVFAALCKDAGVRAYVMILERNEDNSESEDHAVVVIDLDEARRTAGLEGPPLSSVRMSPHVYQREIGRDHVAWKPGRAGLVIDVTRALDSNRGGANFDSACQMGAALLEDNVRYDVAYMIDISALHEEGYPEFEKPDDPSRAIRTSLPDGPRFRSYRSRRGIVESLKGRHGTIVLCGEPGTGKSMLALEIAAQAVDGCGWVIDAADNTSLVTQLAAESLSDLGLTVEGQETAGLKDLANAARRRLEAASGPWVVVLDNANGNPADLEIVPRPDPGRGQLLLVTTTNEAWRNEVPKDCFETLSLLEEQDAEGRGVVTKAGGLPLFLEAGRKFLDYAGRVWYEDDVPPTPERRSELFVKAAWQALEREPETVRTHTRELALALAWLPPAPVPLSVLAGGFPETNVQHVTRLLDRVGLVDLVEDTQSVSMHRLLREGVLAEWKGEQLEVVLPLLTNERTRAYLQSIPDLSSLDAMAGLVTDGTPDDTAVRVLHSVAMIVERHDSTKAAALYNRMLERIGDDVHGAYRLLAVDGYRGRGRATLRSGSPELYDAEIETIRYAMGLSAGTDDDSRLEAYRCEAILGILLQRLSTASRTAAERESLLLEAEHHLRHSADERAKLAERDSPDVDRSRYNLAGLEIELAKLRRDETSQHLQAADDLYREIRAIRGRRYQTEQLEEVACCINGRGIVAYYRAVLLPGMVEEKIKLLREADRFAHEASVIRAELAGALESAESVKSLALDVKIKLARLRLDRVVRLGRPPGRLDDLVPAELHLGQDDKKPELDQMLGNLTTDVKGSSMSSFSFAPVQQIGAGDDLVGDIGLWLDSAPLRALVREFGGDPESLAGPGSVAERLARFDAFTNRWDTRIDPKTGQLRERNEAGSLDLTPEQEELVLAAADALGMRQVQLPRHREYDHVFVLGGLVRACVNRPAYAAHLIKKGLVKAGEVVALGGHRPFRGDEFPLAEAAGLTGLAEEYDALDLGTRKAFHLSEPESTEGETCELVGGTWNVRRYRAADGTPVVVAAAPSSEPETRRANTPDTYRWFAERLGSLKPGQRVLAITTPIYLWAQHAAALRMLALPYGVEVETIGNDPALVAPVLDQPFAPTNYLQEIRTAARSIGQLLAAIDSAE